MLEFIICTAQAHDYLISLNVCLRRRGLLLVCHGSRIVLLSLNHGVGESEEQQEMRENPLSLVIRANVVKRHHPAPKWPTTFDLRENLIQRVQ